MSISVIITTYNDSIYLEKAIISVHKQKLIPNEIIVIDDGSYNLSSYLVVNKLRSPNIKLKYYYQNNFGVSSARNLGILKSRSKYICFLDCDDEMFESNLYDKYLYFNNLDDSYFGVYGNFINSDNSINLKFNIYDGIPNPNDIGISNCIPGSSAAYLFNRKSLLSIGGYDINLKNFEDYDLIIRMSLSNLKCVGTNIISFKRNIRDNSASRNTNFIKTMNNINDYYIKAKIFKYYDDKFIDKKIKLNYYKTVIKLILYDDKYYKYTNKIKTLSNLINLGMSVSKNKSLLDYSFLALNIFLLMVKKIFNNHE